eukprot:scaffold155_cov347-Pavlova_lutheri.AAC.69
MATNATNAVATVREYVRKMLVDVTGMKVLLLDRDTLKVVSTVYSQSEILQQEVRPLKRAPDRPP